jgi:YD repeat-containing protein
MAPFSQELEPPQNPGRFNITTQVMDKRGRVTQRADKNLGTWNYQYTALDQLKQQTDAKNQTTSWTYDRLGRIKQVAAPDTTNTFTYDTATKGIGKLTVMGTAPATGNPTSRTHTHR